MIKCLSCSNLIENDKFHPKQKFCSHNCCQRFLSRSKDKKCKDCRKTITNRHNLCVSCCRREDKHPLWKGENQSYGRLHIWIRKHKQKPEVCEICKNKRPFDVANISQNYKRDINDFLWLCRSCHIKQDGRIKNLKQYGDD